MRILPRTDMPRLPAFCKACGAVSPSPLRASRPDGDVAFDVPSPCRACGASARVPAEVLQRLTRAVAAAARSGLSEEDLGRLSELGFEEDRDGADETPVERVALVSRIADRAPRLLPVTRALPSGTRTELAAFLRVVAAALPVPDPGSEAEVVEAVGRALGAEFDEARREEGSRDEEDRDLARARRRLDAAGRNDPCPCGSGDKYKVCHWREDRTRVRG